MRAVRVERTEKTIGYWRSVVFSKNRPLSSEDLIVRTLRLWRELFSCPMNLPEAEPVTVSFGDAFATPETWMGLQICAELFPERVEEFADGTREFLVFSECVFCGYRTTAQDVEGRKEQMLAHDPVHPREPVIQGFLKFREALYYAAMDACPFCGLDAYQWPDLQASRRWRGTTKLMAE
jgi:hypothetical protein